MEQPALYLYVTFTREILAQERERDRLQLKCDNRNTTRDILILFFMKGVIFVSMHPLFQLLLTLKLIEFLSYYVTLLQIL